MTIRMVGSVAHMEGDWSMAGVADNIASMAISLKQLESKGKKSFRINCEKIKEVDSSVLQLLNVWVECAKLRGIKPKLVNVTDGMLRTINELGFNQLFSDTYLDIHSRHRALK